MQALRRGLPRQGAQARTQRLALAQQAAAPARARRVAIVARKFTFSTTEIRARAGESLVLELTAIDFVHGFSLPELGTRVDVPPGRSVELTLPVLRAGRFTFLCDNFCGEGHEQMHGVLWVMPADPASPG